MWQPDLANGEAAIIGDGTMKTKPTYPAVGFKIHREHFKDCYSIELETGRCLFATTDFQRPKSISTLTLHEGDKVLGVSYMPWTAREIHLGFSGSDPLQGTHWEDMEKEKLPWKGIDRREYGWTAHLSGGEKTSRLIWVTNSADGMSGRSYRLLDSQNKATLAEFLSKKSQFTGGTLKICGSWAEGHDVLHVKVLLAFLSVYETGRRRAHRIVYGSSKGGNMHFPS